MKGLTCKDCPYWDNKHPSMAVAPDSVGLCRINAPVPTESVSDFPQTADNDWCYHIRPELEKRLKEITEDAARKARREFD